MVRSDEELELFERMDIERRREENEAPGGRKPRLIEESELPDFLNQVPLLYKVSLSFLYRFFFAVDINHRQTSLFYSNY